MVPRIDQSQASEGDSTIRVFQGFDPITANFLYCPNQFFDVLLSQCNNRGIARIVGYVLRQQLGWVDQHGNLINENVTVSRDDIIHKAGVSNGAAAEVLDGAISLGFLRCIQDPKPNARNQSARNGTYEIRWDRTGQYITQLESFRGFHAGSHFTPVPNQFFDDVLPNNPLSEIKVAGGIIRHTIGYETKFGQRKQVAALSHSLLAEFTNLSTGKVINTAIQSVLFKGYIQCVKKGKFDPRGRHFGETSEYAMNWRRTNASTTNAPKSPVKERSKKPSNRNTSLNNNNKIHVAVEFQEPFDLLMQVVFDSERFDEDTALKLAERGLDIVKRQIAWIPKRTIDENPLGFLRRAIEKDWKEPIDTDEQQRQRNRDGARKESEALTANTTKQDEVDRAKQELRQRRKQVLPRWNALSKDEQNSTEQSASKNLNSGYHRKLFDTDDEFHLEKCIDEFCRQEGAVPTTTT